MLNTVKIPQQFEAIFLKAQEYVSRYFAERHEDPTKGAIEIFGQRYVLVRASSMSVEFFEMVRDMYSGQDAEQAMLVARSLLFDMAHAMGLADARSFHAATGVEDPIEKLSAGPIHFAHCGWAFVEIFPESSPTPDDDYYLLYDHPYSFEADAWLRSGKPVDHAVCVMNAGYSSGWCEQSFGVELVSAEISCRAKGDEACRFIMAPPDRIDGHVMKYVDAHPELAEAAANYQVPRFFSRKLAEEELQKAYNQLELKVSERTAELEESNRKLQAEVEDRERAEAALKLSYSFLEIATRHTSMDALLEDYLEELQHHSGCEAVSVAVLGKDGRLAHKVYTGFSRCPVTCALEHAPGTSICRDMLRGRLGARDLLPSPGGVIFFNSTSHYTDTLTEAERGKVCDPCQQFGSESLAMAPVKVGEDVVGLIHVGSEDVGRIHARLVEVLEIAAMQLGTAVARLSTQAALRESEAMYRTLVETSPEGIALTDLSGDIIKANWQAARHHGFEHPEQMVGLSAMELIAPDDRRRASKDLAVIAEGKIKETKTVEYRLLRQDGSTFPAEFHAAEIRGAHGEVTHVMTTFSDISERKQVQAKLALSDRMSSVGMLAAGVAHEINNPLSYVLLNVESLAEDLPRLTTAFSRCHQGLVDAGDPKVVAEALGDAKLLANPEMLQDLRDQAVEAKEGARRVRDIVRDLKTFSSTSDVVPAPLSINQALNTAISMAVTEIKYRAQVVRDYGDIPEVVISEGHISQVFLNLLLNAAGAIKEGDIAGNEIRISTRADGDHVVVEVCDTGRGIPPAQLGRVFEPLFSTKQPGAGLGLGLTICHNIVTSAGGTITVDSELGQGTCFTVRLPVDNTDDEDDLPLVTELDDEKTPARRTVLVVDDEPTIGAALARQLRQEHKVVVVTSGVEARKLLEVDDARFDLVFCDILMPEVTGIDLHEWAEEHRPGLLNRVVYITGSDFMPRVAEFLERIPNRVLYKPFDPDQVRKVMGEILGKVD